MTFPAAATLRGREAALALMQDACVVKAADIRTGPSTSITGTQRYSGPCRVQEAQVPTTTATTSDNLPAWAAQQKLVSVPITVTAIEIGDTLTITASAQDPDLIGRQFRVFAVSSKTHLTARRLHCEEINTLGFATDRITVQVPDVTIDIYGSSIPNWSSVSSTTVVGIVQPVGVDEVDGNDGRNQGTNRYRVWLPEGTNVTAESRLLWQGQTLDVTGPPQYRSDSTTGLPIEVLAVQITG